MLVLGKYYIRKDADEFEESWELISIEETHVILCLNFVAVKMKVDLEVFKNEWKVA